MDETRGRAAVWPPVWWALGFSLLTVAALGALTSAVYVVDILAAGVLMVFDAGGENTSYRVDADRYLLAVFAGTATALAVSVAAVVLLARSRFSGLSAAMTGAGAALLAAPAAVAATCLVLGINPLDLL